MNYRHHFHAGNFADVMKHVLLLQLLTRLNAKDNLIDILILMAGRASMIYHLRQRKNLANS